ncbi:Long chain acyl-CoA synthetase 8 [Thelohanellus kitauei]|uniref:long-chain-fatty-acid--CoA ligase n=1 Tax=Thelohanellus kitauei TaxID=669202 RepID=A0A0C2J044_THEKT|nr:Long chain acyl-CoA synthetase 8 [Thelohanellus kitauei]
MALFTKTCPMWLMCAFALFQISSPVVTIYSTLSDENLVFALILSEAHAILVDSKSFERLIPLIKQIPSLKNVFCWVENQDSSKPNLPEDLQLEVVYVNIKMFTETPPPEDVQKIEPLHPGPNDLALIMYTSGTTGPPKGVMITHDNIISTIGITWPEREFWKGKVYLAYLPQAHILELIAESVMSLHGGSLGFGHPFTLFDNSPMIIPGTHGDAVALRPTFFATVPLLCDRIKKAALEKIEKSSEIKKIIFETAYNIKLNYLRAGLETPYLDKKIFKVFKDVLGGSASHAFIGGASLNRETEDFFSACFGRFKLAFGLTETCCAGALSNFDYWRTGNCGPITKCVELKLIPWEEGNYNPSDKNPRGEICISGKPVSSGYYKNQEETDKAFIKDEKTGKIWFRTGDIGEILPDGTLRIVDRRKDIIKLKHGEYLSLVRVEQIIIQLKLVDMVCVMPNADCDYLVALIVPNREFCKEFFSKLDKKYHKMHIEDLLKDENATSKLRDEIAKNLQEMKCLDKYETPKKFFILSDLWTAESGILTPSAKLRRPIIAEKYKHLIKPNQDTPI